MREVVWNNQLLGALQTLYTCEQGTTLGCCCSWLPTLTSLSLHSQLGFLVHYEPLNPGNKEQVWVKG